MPTSFSVSRVDKKNRQAAQRHQEQPMSDKYDKKFWLLVLKLAIGAIVLMTLFGLGLYYSAKYKTYAVPDTPAAPDWGISKDSPIRNKR